MKSICHKIGIKDSDGPRKQMHHLSSLLLMHIQICIKGEYQRYLAEISCLGSTTYFYLKHMRHNCHIILINININIIPMPLKKLPPKQGKVGRMYTTLPQ